MKIDWANNLEKLRTLSNKHDVVPYSMTTNKDGTILKDMDDIRKGRLLPIHKDKDYAILVGEIEKDFVHQKHTHEEYEMLCILSGKAIVKYEDKIEELISHRPIIIAPNVEHEVYYIEDTRLLAVTMPASDGFPNIDEVNNAARI